MNKLELVRKLNQLYNQWMQNTIDTDDYSYDLGYEKGQETCAYELEVIISELEKENVS